MGSGKSKDQLKDATMGGLISTAKFNERWYRYCTDGLQVSRVNALAFLGSIAQDCNIEISERELGEIVDNCSNPKGEFRYPDMMILFDRFAKEYRVGLTATLEGRIEQEIELQKGVPKKDRARGASSSEYNPFLDNRAAPSRAEDLQSYVTEQIRARTFASYLSLLPRDVLNCALKYLEASEIMRNQIGIDKIWEIGDNKFGHKFLLRGNACLVFIGTSIERVLKAVCVDNGTILWESEKLKPSWSSYEAERVCVNATGYVFYFTSKVVVFEPPNRHWVQTLSLPPPEDVATLQHRVYAVCKLRTAEGSTRSLYCIEQQPGKREFAAKFICKLPVVETQDYEFQYAQIQFDVMSSASHGDIAIISYPLELALVFLETGKIATVKLEDQKLLYYYPIITGSRLVYVGTKAVRVFSLDELSDPLYQYEIPSVGNVPWQQSKCQLRIQPDGTVCAVHIGECITILHFTAQGEKFAERRVQLQVNASPAAFAWHLSGDTLLLASDLGRAHWINLSEAKIRMTEDLHDGGFGLGIYIHGDYLLSGGSFRLKCWKARI